MKFYAQPYDICKDGRNRKKICLAVTEIGLRTLIPEKFSR